MHICKKQPRAITLVEILVVLAVLGITFAMGATFIRYHTPSIALHQGASALRNDLQEARALALTYQHDYAVVFHIASSTYDIIQLEPTLSVLKQQTLPEHIDFTMVGPFMDNMVRFNTAGAASESGNVQLVNTQGVTQTITIQPTGFISSQ